MLTRVVHLPFRVKITSHQLFKNVCNVGAAKAGDSVGPCPHDSSMSEIDNVNENVHSHGFKVTNRDGYLYLSWTTFCHLIRSRT